MSACGLVRQASRKVPWNHRSDKPWSHQSPGEKQKLWYSTHTFLPSPGLTSEAPWCNCLTDLFFIQMAGVLYTDLKCWLCLGHAYSVSLESHYSLISRGNEISASHCVRRTWPLTPHTKSAFCQAGVECKSLPVCFPGSGPSWHMAAPPTTTI